MTCEDCIHVDVCEEWHEQEMQRACYYGEYFKNKADFVEVVRCKDCKYFYADTYASKVLRRECRLRSIGNGIGCVRLDGENDFCSYGERKENE